jgi:hypothetical protein
MRRSVTEADGRQPGPGCGVALLRRLTQGVQRLISTIVMKRIVDKRPLAALPSATQALASGEKHPLCHGRR